MRLRLQVGLIALFALLGACCSAVFFSYDCDASGIEYLVVFVPPVITGVLCQSFWRRLTLQIFIRCSILAGVLSFILLPLAAKSCDFNDADGNPKKDLEVEKWLTWVPTSICFLVGARLVWKKIEDMDPRLTQRLSVEAHSAVIFVTFLWPLTLGIFYATNSAAPCTQGLVTYTVLFGVPIAWSISVHVSHTKLTRNTFGYLLIFMPGMLGWFLIPLVAVNCQIYKTQSWIIMGVYPLFCLLSGARFVKFYDVRHPEQHEIGVKKQDHGFINTGSSIEDAGLLDIEQVKARR